MAEDQHMDEDNEYEVEKILDHRKKGRQTEYQVKWKGYSDKDNTWEPQENCHSLDLMEEFQNQRRKKEKNAPKKKKANDPMEERILTGS